jgi:hypothetical protein
MRHRSGHARSSHARSRATGYRPITRYCLTTGYRPITRYCLTTGYRPITSYRLTTGYRPTIDRAIGHNFPCPPESPPCPARSRSARTT